MSCFYIKKRYHMTVNLQLLIYIFYIYLLRLIIYLRIYIYLTIFYIIYIILHVLYYLTRIYIYIYILYKNYILSNNVVEYERSRERQDWIIGDIHVLILKTFQSFIWRENDLQLCNDMRASTHYIESNTIRRRNSRIYRMFT